VAVVRRGLRSRLATCNPPDQSGSRVRTTDSKPRIQSNYPAQPNWRAGKRLQAEVSSRNWLEAHRTQDTSQTLSNQASSTQTLSTKPHWQPGRKVLLASKPLHPEPSLGPGKSQGLSRGADPPLTPLSFRAAWLDRRRLWQLLEQLPERITDHLPCLNHLATDPSSRAANRRVPCTHLEDPSSAPQRLLAEPPAPKKYHPLSVAGSPHPFSSP
jgi:hypothetical protein